jgi:hypothetical protein
LAFDDSPTGHWICWWWDPPDLWSRVNMQRYKCNLKVQSCSCFSK